MWASYRAWPRETVSRSSLVANARRIMPGGCRVHHVNFHRLGGVLRRPTCSGKAGGVDRFTSVCSIRRGNLVCLRPKILQPARRIELCESGVDQLLAPRTIPALTLTDLRNAKVIPTTARDYQITNRPGPIWRPIHPNNSETAKTRSRGSSVALIKSLVALFGLIMLRMSAKQGELF